jgi:pilus assembly protein Flp/PilA
LFLPEQSQTAPNKNASIDFPSMCLEKDGSRSRGSVVGITFRNVLSRRKTMQKLSNVVVRFLKNEDGPTAVEYAVMLALIIVVCITAVTTLGSNANKTFTSVGTAVGGAAS